MPVNSLRVSSCLRAFVFPPLVAFALAAQTAPQQSKIENQKSKISRGAPIQLFNGKDLAGWSWHPSAPSKIDDVWTVRDGVLHCGPRPTGYIRLDQEFKNFILTLEYRHLTAANGGTFICIHGDDKVWPDAVQIQGNFGKVGDLINQNTGMKKMTTDPARTKTVNRDVVISRMGTSVEKPLGQWNTLVITMEAGNLTVKLNDQLVNTAADIAPDAGKVGLQAEGAEMDFRKVELTPIE